MNKPAGVSAWVVGIVFATCALSAGRALPSHAASPHEPYVPGLGEFMTSGVQPHHIKLWLAATSADWKLAAYEANELAETFDDIKTNQPEWHELHIARLVQATVLPQLRRIDAAIAAKDLSQFKSVYADLNTACNGCHEATQHGFVKIVVPSGNPFVDQGFGEH